MDKDALAEIQRGLMCEKNGKLEEAEGWFALGIIKLDAIFSNSYLTDSQFLDLKKHLQLAANHMTANYQIINLKNVQKKDERKKRENHHHSAVILPHALTPKQASNLSPAREQKQLTKQVQTRNLLNHSLFVYSFFGIRKTFFAYMDTANGLKEQNKYKEAGDVVRYAYDFAKTKRDLPANFYNILDVIVDLRRKYYEFNEPRFMQDNPILPSEMEILRNSSNADPLFLPIWDDLHNGYASENVFMLPEEHWEEPSLPELSPTQLANGARYMRIGDIQLGSDLCIISTADPLNVKQTVVGDCSMVCSLIICASYQQRFKAKIFDSVIYPQDHNGVPIISPKGKYCVKMFINGITRLVCVDDRFPANPKNKLLLCTYSKDKTELWVSIMEKAFVKVCGQSYDFLGSTSGSDLYKLSGWLPEYVSFESDEFDHDRQWRRFFNAHVSGSAVMTVSTSKISQEEEERLLLVSSHAYAVLKLVEINNVRLLQLRNPWGRRSWRGLYSFDDWRSEAVALLSELQYTEALANEGIFWITWDDLCRHFARCALSWNPYLLFKTPDGKARRPTRISCHASFPYTMSTGQMPQFHIGVINTSRPSRMHLVFARHISSVKEFGTHFQENSPSVAYVALNIYNVTQYPSIAQHLGLSCTFEKCYCRRLAAGTELNQQFEPLNNVLYQSVSEYTTSFTCPSGTNSFVVVVSRTESSVKSTFSFSLTLHTEWPQVKLNDKNQASTGVYMHIIPQTNLKYCSVTKGKWEKGKSCGGRSSIQTFVYNPQYLLKLTRPSMLLVRLNVPECKVPAQVYVARKKENPNKDLVSWSARVGAPETECSFVLHAPMYACGGVVVDTGLRSCIFFGKENLFGERHKDPNTENLGLPPPLPAGEYTIVPAQWENGVPAEFELVVETTESHELSEVPIEGFGLVKNDLRGEFTGHVTAADSAELMSKSDTFFSSNSKACFEAASPCVFACRFLLLEKSDTGGDVVANLTLFRSRDAVTMERVASSGPYRKRGVALPPMRVNARERYVLVVSSATASREKYVLRLYSSYGLNAWLQ